MYARVRVCEPACVHACACEYLRVCTCVPVCVLCVMCTVLAVGVPACHRVCTRMQAPTSCIDACFEPLIWFAQAVKHNRPELLEVLVRQGGCKVASRDYDGNTPLHLATKSVSNH
jgi:hypothetical protein